MGYCHQRFIVSCEIELAAMKKFWISGPVKGFAPVEIAGASSATTLDAVTRLTMGTSMQGCLIAASRYGYFIMLAQGLRGVRGWRCLWASLIGCWKRFSMAVDDAGRRRPKTQKLGRAAAKSTVSQMNPGLRRHILCQFSQPLDPSVARACQRAGRRSRPQS